MLGCILQRQALVIMLLNTYASIKMGDMISQKCKAATAMEAPRSASVHVALMLSSSRAATLKQALDDLFLDLVLSDYPRQN